MSNVYDIFERESNRTGVIFKYYSNLKIKNLDRYLKDGENSFLITFQNEDKELGEDAIFLFINLYNIFYLETIYILDLSKFSDYIKSIEKFFIQKITNLKYNYNLYNIIQFQIYLYTPIYVNLDNENYIFIRKCKKTSFLSSLNNTMKEHVKKLVFKRLI
jgi:hypothetical protein